MNYHTMWSNIFLDTANEDFTTTISTPVEIPDWLSCQSDVSATAKVWGSNDGQQNRQTFETISEGDYILLYRVDEKIYAGIGKVQVTVETDWFAKKYWKENNQNRCLIYILSDFDEREMAVQDVNQLLGYKEIYHPHGLQRVADDRKKEALIAEFALD